MLGVDVGPLVGAGEERSAPVLGRHDRIAARTHRDEAGQVLVLRAQAVGDPGAHAGALQAAVAAIHQHQRRFMIGHVGIHRSDDAEVVDVLLGRAGEQLAHLDAAPAVFAECKGRAQRGAGLALGAEIRVRQGLAVVSRQERLGVEGVDLRRPAVHEQVDDLSGLAGELGRFRRHRAERSGRRWRPRVSRPDHPQRSLIGQHTGQADQSQAHPASREQVSAGQGEIVVRKTR